MPRVPTYDDPQATPQNLPDARQQAPSRMMQQADIGPGQQMKLGQAIEGMGNEISHEAIARQIQDNESAAKNADTSAIAATQAMLYGTPDNPDAGYLSKQGGQAVDGLKDIQDKLGESKTKILSGLQNDAQRQIAANAIEMRFQDAGDRVTRHAGQQRQVREISDSRVRESASADAAQKTFDPAIDGADPTYHYNMDSDNPADKSAYQTYLHTVMVERQHQTDLAGNAGGDTGDGIARQGLENVYAGIAMNYIATRQPEAAQNFLDAINKNSPGAISAEAMRQLQPQLASAMQQHVVVGKTQQLQEANPGNLGAQLKNLNEMYRGKQVDDAQFAQIHSGLNIAAAEAERQGNKKLLQTLGQAQDYIIKNPGATVKDLPQPLYNELQAKGQLASIDGFAGQRSTTPPQVWFGLINHFGDGGESDITRINDANWLAMRGHMSENDWRQFSLYRKDAINDTAGGRDDPDHLSLSGFKASLESRLATIGLSPQNAVTTGDKNRLGAVQQYAYQSVVADQRATQRKFNHDEIAKSLDKLFLHDDRFKKLLWK